MTNQSIVNGGNWTPSFLKLGVFVAHATAKLSESNGFER